MTTELSEIQELRARIANLEAAITSLQPSRSRLVEATGSNTARHHRDDSPESSVAVGLSRRHGSRNPAQGLAAVSVRRRGGTVNRCPSEIGGPGPWSMEGLYSQTQGGARRSRPGRHSEERPRYLVGRPWSGHGHYWQFGRTVVVKAWVQFSAGTQPGNGQYRLTLPVPAAVGGDAWVTPMGTALMRHASTKTHRNANVPPDHRDACGLLARQPRGQRCASRP